MPGADGGFVVPNETERRQWREVVRQMMDGNCENVDLSNYGWRDAFTVTTFLDDENQNSYCVLMEIGTSSGGLVVSRGWGTFIYDAKYQLELNISAPHPKYEYETAAEAIGVFKGTRSRTFLMAGTDRRASTKPSKCQVDCFNSDCRKSDAAHNTDHMFHATVAELVRYYNTQNSKFYHLQFHGMKDDCGKGEEEGCDVYLSHGSSQKPKAGDQIRELSRTLSISHTDWLIGVPGDDTCKCDKNGTKNVQGRLLNGVCYSRVCEMSASDYSGYFIHIEQGPGYRAADDWVQPIISAAWPSLAVSNQSNLELVLDGESLTYTLYVTNTGNVPLTATITDILPAHVIPGGIRTWVQEIPPSGGVFSEEVVVTVEPGYSGPLANVVQVTTNKGITGRAGVTVCANDCKMIYLPIVLKKC